MPVKIQVAALPFLILLAPLLIFLRYHDYPLLAPESLAELALFAAFALLAAIGLASGRPRITAITLTALILLFIDYQFEMGHRLPKLVHGVLPLRDGVSGSLAAFVAAGILYAIFLRIHAAIQPVLTAIFGVVVLSGMVIPGDHTPDQTTNAAVARTDSNPPLTIHIVLDEHAAADALPADIPEAAAVRAEMAALYAPYGFRLWTRSFSRFFDTEESMAATMNFAGSDYQEALKNIAETKSPFAWTLTRNAYFQAMHDRGYRIHVYQTPHMDYCSQSPVPIELCRAFPATSIKMLVNQPLRTWDKFSVLHGIYNRQSFAYLMIRRSWQRLGGTWEWDHDSVGPIPSMIMLDDILADARRSKTGTFIFAHLLTPHHPYAYAADCTLRSGNQPWLAIEDQSIGGGVSNTPESRALRYRQYAGQIRCLNQALAKLFDGLKEDGLWEHATIILHGDHGSRITQHEPHAKSRDKVTEQDLRDGFAAHLAIRHKAFLPGPDESGESIHDAIRRAVLGTAGAADPRTLFLKDREHWGMFVPVSMPPFADSAVSAAPQPAGASRP